MPFRIALLKLNSQEAAQYMAQRQHEQALVIAMDAVKEGQDLFKPLPLMSCRCSIHNCLPLLSCSATQVLTG